MNRQRALIGEISALIPTGLTGPWRKLTFNRSALSMLSEHELIVERPDGTLDKSARVPFEVDDLLNELRKVMYTPGAGTWMSAQWTITDLGDGHADVRATFNYDGESRWSMPVRAFNYAIDVRDFPQDDGDVPNWLRQQLAEVAPESA
ncbi:agglutinin cell wall attachment protein [Nocardioides sp. YIM B13467]|uniref:agglutinin cell wall attachment protein n=1 Tax=Nocardioides sp. YIM B13467 TaxID=3366294 RepID=UPI00366BE8E1